MMKLKMRLAPIGLLVAILILWEAFAVGLQIDKTVLPSFSAILSAFQNKFIAIILPDLVTTMKNLLLGYLIAVPVGILIAALLAQSATLVKIATPLIIVTLVTPIIVIVPILIPFIGFTAKVKVIVVILQTTPIIILNSLVGFSNVEQDKVDLMKSYGANRWEIFRKIIFMNALPRVFAGLELGCILSTIGAVSGDIAVGAGGIGTRIQIAASTLATDTVFACILSVCLLAILLFQIVVWIERKVIAWK
ncbi:ABC transporter permease subunit [Lachnospiraceae bacterium ZAX-1]